MFKPGDIVRGKQSGNIYHIDAVTEHHVCYTRLVRGAHLAPRFRHKTNGVVKTRYWQVTKIGQNYKAKT